VVIDDTPAFNADVLVDDIITAVDGQTVVDVASMNAMLKARRGKQVTLSLLRGNQRIDKSIQLNP